jgi:hypothetical protein
MGSTPLKKIWRTRILRDVVKNRFDINLKFGLPIIDLCVSRMLSEIDFNKAGKSCRHISGEFGQEIQHRYEWTQ